jgi:hypothetical protein
MPTEVSLMMLTTERWAHGTIVQSEDHVDFVARRGWGTHFGMRNAGEVWFHFPLPTIATIGESHLLLTKVYVFYRADGAVVKSLHVYDGPQQKRTFDDLALTGDHSGEKDAENQWALEPPLPLTCGIGISVRVEFQEGANVGLMSEILFTAAGAEFLTPPSV